MCSKRLKQDKRDIERSPKDVKSNRNNRRRKSGPKIDSKGMEGPGYVNSEGLKATNDVSWYSADPQLLLDCTKIQFDYATGQPINLSNGGVATRELTGDSVPGICVIKYATVPGISKDAASSLMISARNHYVFTRFINNGAKSYEPADQMILMLAMDQLYSFIAHMKRAYGVMCTWNPRNSYYPEALVEGMNLDFEDIKSNLNDFKAWINFISNQVATFAIPADLPFVQRHMWMNSFIYLDNQTVKAQSYMFVPSKFYKYNEYAVEGSEYKGGELAPIDFAVTHKPWKVSELMELFESMVSAIMGSEDAGIIIGDIYKAYGDEKLFKMSTIPDDYTVVPVYDPVVMSQIQNASLVGWLDNTKITQDPLTGIIYSQPTTTVEKNATEGLLANRILTSLSAAPTAADIIEATRLMVIPNKISASKDNPNINIASYNAVGTEIAEVAKICKFGSNSAGQWVPQWSENFCNTITAEFGNPKTFGTELKKVKLLADLESFDQHPSVNLYIGSQETTDGTTYTTRYKYCGNFYNINNFAVVSKDQVAQMHRTCILSEFQVKQMGK